VSGVSENPYARFMGSETARPEQRPRQRKTHSHDLIRSFEKAKSYRLSAQPGVTLGFHVFWPRVRLKF